VNEDAVFRRLLAELAALRLPPIRLTRIFFSITDELNGMYRMMLAEPIAIDDFFPTWCRFVSWIEGVRDNIRQANTRSILSDEIQNSIVRAMSIVGQKLSEPVSAAEIAQMVNMSGSYFSQCFKQFAGQTYTDYVRDLRLERAKQYLRNTTKTIQWVAEQIGYNDEKYFSRLFREHVGMLPSEYRSSPESRKSR
jgi:two-component system, response regulator YesN